jgi:hypothetical protein
MADDRLFHKRLGHSEKVNALSAEEELVWRTYVQEADDFGVMLMSGIEIQRGHDRFRNMRTKVVQQMLDRVLTVGLLRAFEHQGRVYCYQIDWQTYQKVRYALGTINPRIPAALLQLCDLPTQWLHTLWPGAGGRGRKLSSWTPPDGWMPPSWTDRSVNVPATAVETVPSTFPERSGNVPPLARRARARSGEGDRDREILGGAGGGATAVQDPQPSDATDELRERAGRFCERYAELYAEHRHGARYHNKPTLDFVEALGLVATWDDQRLDLLVEAFLVTDDPFCRNGAGSIAQFRSRASWCDAKLRERGL